MKTMGQKEIQTESSEQIECMLCQRIEELEKEKLELNEQLDIAQQERDEAARDLAMEQEHHQANRRSEEALAAHVERLRTAWRQYENSEYCSEDEIKAEEQLYALMEEDPATSLARLIAEKQAEALEELYRKVEGCPAVGRSTILNYAVDLRRQAEGDET